MMREMEIKYDEDGLKFALNEKVSVNEDTQLIEPSRRASYLPPRQFTSSHSFNFIQSLYTSPAKKKKRNFLSNVLPR